MYIEDLKIKVIRKKQSYRYMKEGLNEYQRRTRNNMIDSLILYKKDDIIFASKKVQTVSNHPQMKYFDTIRKGAFQVKCFVEQRNFNTPVHGIINAYDISNQKINEYAMQNDNGQYIGRWLIHSSWYNKLGRDTKAYSGGCFIMSTRDMMKFNNILINNKIKADDIITGLLIEVI